MPLDDKTAIRMDLCRSTVTAAAARTKSMSVGFLPSWSGMDSSFVDFARNVGRNYADERSVLEALFRASSQDSGTAL